MYRDSLRIGIVVRIKCEGRATYELLQKDRNINIKKIVLFVLPGTELPLPR